MKSYLLTDFGIAHTRTILIDMVEGQYRLISGAITRTTVAPPEGDVTMGLERNIEQIQQRSGRLLINQEGMLIRPMELDGTGLDEFVATASNAGRPLRAVLLAVMDDFSLASARHALTGTYIEEVDSLTLAQQQSEEARINAILRGKPDVIFIAGGTEGGNEDAVRRLLDLVEVAIRLKPEGTRPIVLYAGNSALADEVIARFEPYSVVDVADNVRPTPQTESLNSAKLKLAQVFDRFLKYQPGGFTDISDISATGITPTAQSALRLVRYLDALDNSRGVVYLDVGSGTSTLLSSLNNVVTSNIRSNLGIGHHAQEVAQVLDWRDVERWLPFAFSHEAFEAWALNKSMHPLTIPQTIRDLFIEQAVAKEITRLLLRDSQNQWDSAAKSLPTVSPLIVGGAVFTQNIPPRLSVLMILDALQPQGITDVWIDPYGVAPALGALSHEEPLAVVQIIDNEGFTKLSTTFCPVGNPRRGKMTVTITLPSGESLQNTLGIGDLWLPELSAGIRVEVDVRLSRGLSINGKRRFTGTLETGVAGLSFDMRGRPLNLPSGRRRRRVVSEWFTQATGITIDEAMLEETFGADDLTVEVGAMVGEEDFPTYKKLPNQEPDPAFQRLLAPVAIQDDFPELDDFSDNDGDDNLGDLRKELGL